MSPEQAQGADVDARTDIWSLGVMLFEMLTGELPFRGDHEAALLYSIVHENPRALSSLRPELPAPVSSIISKVLQKGPRAAISDHTRADRRSGEAHRAERATPPRRRSRSSCCPSRT